MGHESNNEVATPQTAMLSKRERWLAGFTALGLLAIFLLLYLYPPHRQVAVQGCLAEDPENCVVTVSADPGAEAPALVAASAFLVLIAVLGRRFNTVKLPGGAELSGGEANEVPDDTPELEVSAGRAEPIGHGVTERPVNLWHELPTWCQTALYTWAAENPVLKIPISDALTTTHKPSGQGNHAWYVRIDDGQGTTRTLRVSTGRGSSQAQDAEQ